MSTETFIMNPGVARFNACRLVGQRVAGRISDRGNIVKGGDRGRHIREVRKGDTVFTLHATKGWRVKREA